MVSIDFKMLFGSRLSLARIFVLQSPFCVGSFTVNREPEFTVTRGALLSTGFVQLNESKLHFVEPLCYHSPVLNH